MKFLVPLLVLLLVIPPVQAGSCDMQADAFTPLQGEVQEQAPDSDGHDCCPDRNTDDSREDAPCDGQSHCGSCFVGSSAIPVAFLTAAPVLNRAPFVFEVRQVAPSHAIPPFRPPIA